MSVGFSTKTFSIEKCWGENETSGWALFDIVLKPDLVNLSIGDFWNGQTDSVLLFIFLHYKQQWQKSQTNTNPKPLPKYIHMQDSRAWGRGVGQRRRGQAAITTAFFPPDGFYCCFMFVLELESPLSVALSCKILFFWKDKFHTLKSLNVFFSLYVGSQNVNKGIFLTDIPIKWLVFTGSGSVRRKRMRSKFSHCLMTKISSDMDTSVLPLHNHWIPFKVLSPNQHTVQITSL